MSTNPTPQFNTAQYSTQPPQGPAPDTQGAYPRALLFGLVGAAIGLALYAGFVIVTKIEISYMSLAVGFIIAKLMTVGSKGIGGLKYQITAALLTYCAVSLSGVAVALYRLPHLMDILPMSELIRIGLTAPFTGLKDNTGSGLIGLVILFAGMSIAWKMTAEKVHAA